MRYHGKKVTYEYGHRHKPAYGTRKDWRFHRNDPEGSLSKWWGHRKSYSFFKKESNRKVRRYKSEISDGNSYRKMYDLWWVVY